MREACRCRVYDGRPRQRERRRGAERGDVRRKCAQSEGGCTLPSITLPARSKVGGSEIILTSPVAYTRFVDISAVYTRIKRMCTPHVRSQGVHTAAAHATGPISRAHDRTTSREA